MSEEYAWLTTAASYVLSAIVIPAVAAFLAARFGAAESRRQFNVSAQTRKRVASGELFRAFLDVGSKCEHYIHNVRNFYSSKGAIGVRVTNLDGVTLPDDIIVKASEVDASALSKVLHFIALKSSADASIAFSKDAIGDDDAADDLENWSALLALRAYDIANHARTAGEIDWSFEPSLSQAELDGMAANCKHHTEYNQYNERKQRAELRRARRAGSAMAASRSHILTRSSHDSGNK